MTCCWCNGDHPSVDCWKRMSVERALRIFGPIRAARSSKALDGNVADARYKSGFRKTPLYWLDGKLVKRCELLAAAVRKVRDSEK